MGFELIVAWVIAPLPIFFLFSSFLDVKNNVSRKALLIAGLSVTVLGILFSPSTLGTDTLQNIMGNLLFASIASSVIAFLFIVGMSSLSNKA